MMTRFRMARIASPIEPGVTPLLARILALFMFVTVLVGVAALSGASSEHGVGSGEMETVGVSHSVVAEAPMVAEQPTGPAHEPGAATCIGCSPFSPAQTGACTLVLLLLFGVLLLAPGLAAPWTRQFSAQMSTVTPLEALRNPFSLAQLCVLRR